jgi:hypothetical protein
MGLLIVSLESSKRIIKKPQYESKKI